MDFTVGPLSGPVAVMLGDCAESTWWKPVVFGGTMMTYDGRILSLAEALGW